VKLAFATGAIAAGFTAAGLTTLLIWIATVLSGSSDPWSIAPWIVALAAALVGVATYLAERIVHRRSLARKRATGEPWAYRSSW
jgi:apolipoprotein N-acyltransferase